jgi:hypothetical protein
MCPRVSLCTWHFLHSVSLLILALARDTLSAVTLALIFRAVIYLLGFSSCGFMSHALAILSSVNDFTAFPWDWRDAHLAISFFFSLVLYASISEIFRMGHPILAI